MFCFCLVYRIIPLRAARARSRYACTLSKLEMSQISADCNSFLMLGSSCCIQEIGDVNAMKAAYLNDEQIVKAPGSGSWFFRK